MLTVSIKRSVWMEGECENACELPRQLSKLASLKHPHLSIDDLSTLHMPYPHMHVHQQIIAIYTFRLISYYFLAYYRLGTSYELEIFFNGKWLEVLACGVVHQSILDKNYKPGHRSDYCLGLQVG